MKKYIRSVLDDLKKDTGGEDLTPPVPPAPVVPEDLENQTLSDDPEQRVRQLDFQAQQAEERQKLQ